MKNEELVSIITPSYNSSKYIAETIQAVLAQTYHNWELLITDDCSTDNSVEIIKSFCRKDQRIRVFCLKRNSGAGVARNNSIREAKGRFIAFCDSDDKWLPDKLQKQVEFMLQHGYAFSFLSYYQCNENGEHIRSIICKLKISYWDLLVDNCVGCLTAMYDCRKIGGKIYMPAIRKRQDWGLWLILIQKCKYGYGLRETLAEYRVRKGSISSKKLDLVRHNIKVYKEVLGYSILKSYLFFIFFFLPVYCYKKMKQILH